MNTTSNSKNIGSPSMWLFVCNLAVRLHLSRGEVFVGWTEPITSLPLSSVLKEVMMLPVKYGQIVSFFQYYVVDSKKKNSKRIPGP
jgi:hypothetical protein